MLDYYWMHVSLKSRKSLVVFTSNHQLIVCSTGGPIKISVGDHLSEYLITNCTLNEEQRAKQWGTVAKECGLQLSSHTVARILKEHGCQSRRIPPLKPPLHKDHKQYRKDFTFWALERLVAGDIFVFSDEMWVENGQMRGTQRVTMPRGINSNCQPRKARPKGFRYMFWGAFCIGFRGLCHLWEMETKEERK